MITIEQFLERYEDAVSALEQIEIELRGIRHALEEIASFTADIDHATIENHE